jgi:hypothetical protein
LFDGVYTTQYDIVLDATIRKTNKYDVNKKWAVLQLKVKHIVFMWKS